MVDGEEPMDSQTCMVVDDMYLIIINSIWKLKVRSLLLIFEIAFLTNQVSPWHNQSGVSMC